jgi:hypothetical protein
MATSYEQLLNSLARSSAMATSANLKRYDEAMSIYDTIISTYSPGGTFGKAARGQLEKQKVQDVGAETQNLISGGMFGSTTQAATGRRWEETVGAPARLKLEDIQMQRLSQAQLDKAGFIERREDVGPDMGMLAGLAMQAGQTQTYQEPEAGTANSPYDVFGRFKAGRGPTTGGTSSPSGGRQGSGLVPSSYGGALNASVPSQAPAQQETPQKMEWEEYYEGRAGIPTSSAPAPSEQKTSSYGFDESWYSQGDQAGKWEKSRQGSWVRK